MTEVRAGMVHGTSLGSNLLGAGGRLLGEEGYIRRRDRFTGKQVRGKDGHTACIGCGGRRVGARGPEYEGQAEGHRLYLV